MSWFRPENELESAIAGRDIPGIVQAIAEGVSLERLAAIKLLGSEDFPEEVVFAVLMISTPRKKLQDMAKSGYFFHHLLPDNASRLKTLIAASFTPLPEEPSPEEKRLIKAIVYGDSEQVCHLIAEENVKFCGFAPELLVMLPELSLEAVLMLLQNGLTAKLKAMIFGIFLAETANADILKSFSYAARVMYANLMLSLMQGEDISATGAWYPEARFCRRSYCFDPEHRYEPFSITHTMLVNSARLKALNSFEPENFLE